VSAGNDVCIDGGNCLSTAGGIPGGWNSSGAIVFDDALVANTWNELDLSSVVGAQEALVILKIKCKTSGNRHMTIKPHGDADDYANDWGAANANQIQVGFMNTYYLAIVTTDNNGSISLNPWAFVDSWEIKLLGYIK